MRASHQAPRLPLIFDGNLDTRWMTGERQNGSEWVEVRLPQPADVRRLEIVGGGRTILDYPQRLRIDSTGPAGISQSLFDDGVVDLYVEAVAFNDLHPSITLDLPRNRTVVLRHPTDRARRQAGGRSHELEALGAEGGAMNTSSAPLAILLP